MADIANLVLQIIRWFEDPAKSLFTKIKDYEEKLTYLVQKAKTLETRQKDIKASTDAAESRDEAIKGEVSDWMKRVETLTNDFTEFENNARNNLTCVCGFLPNCRRRSRLSAQADKLLSRIKSVLDEPRFEAVSVPPTLPRPKIRTGAATKSFVAFSSTQKALDGVIQALRDGSVRSVGVHGIGGVGKTTMLKEAAARAVAAGLFDLAVFVTITKDPNTEKIQSRLAEFLDLTLQNDQTLERRAELIMHRIETKKRVLVVLDDLWERLKLEAIGIPCGPDLDACGSKILLAMRNENVCHQMSCERKVRLDVWSEPESWEFFKKVARPTGFGSPEFERVARAVVNECRGLPLSLMSVAMAVGDKDESEWGKALNRLRKSRSPNPDDDKDVFVKLKLSYDFLKEEERACFLLCSLFPEDHSIGKEELARYAFGLGVFRETDSVREARDDADSVAKKLVASGMLLDGDKAEQVKMHDVFRDFAIKIASESEDIKSKVQTGSDATTIWPDICESYTSISFISSKVLSLPVSPNNPKLKTLLLQEIKSLAEIPSRFFEKMSALQVLDLNGIEASSLPSSIKNLKSLRVVHLDHCKFVDVTVLGELEKLAILSFRKSAITEWPVTLGKLSNLRMLDLSLSLNIPRIPPKLLSSLYHLEELYLKASFAQWQNGTDQGTSKNASFSELTSLYNLTILHVDIDYANCLPEHTEVAPNWEKFNICLCHDEFVRKMTVHSKQTGVYSRSLLLDTSTKCLPSWFNEVVSKKTETLRYSGCTGLNMVEDHKSGFLSKLKYLVVEQCANVFHLMRPMDTASNNVPVLQSLQELHIHQMDDMEKICDGELPIGSLENLEFLEVQQCKELLNSLLASNLIKLLSNLKRLRVSGNPNITDVFGFENLEEDKYLGRLHEIWLKNLYRLENIWKGPARFADFTKLKLVCVIKCDKLRNMFSISMSEGLTELEDLWIEDCEIMENIIQNEIGVSMDKIRLPKLKTLCVIKLQNLRSVYDGNASLECPSFEYLHVKDCEYFETPNSNFNSSNQVKKNDGQHMKILLQRMK